jgi:transposase
MPGKKYRVSLSGDERAYLETVLKTGKAAAYKRLHAQILLLADVGDNGPGWKDESISQACGVTTRTVERVRQRLVEQGFEAALNRAPQCAPRRRKLDGEGEAHLIALRCSDPPAGRHRWTLQLLADRLMELEQVETISLECVRQTLKKTNLNLGKPKSGVSRPRPTLSLSAPWKTC